MRINYSIILVSDMARSVAFYHDVVGIPVKFESPGWTEFQTEGSTLALHTSHGRKPDPGPEGECAGTCRAGFEVADLEAFHQRMIEHGVPCKQEPIDTFGARVAQYEDPDGLVFSVGEVSPS